MTRITFLCFLLAAVFFSAAGQARNKKDTVALTKASLVGVWQRGTRRVGNGLNQNFRFYTEL